MSRSMSPMGVVDNVKIVDADEKKTEIDERVLLIRAKIAASEFHSKIFTEEGATFKDMMAALQHYEVVITSYQKLLNANHYQNPWKKLEEESGLQDAVDSMNKMAKHFFAEIGLPSLAVIYVNEQRDSHQHKVNMTKLVIEIIKALCWAGDQYLAINDFKNALEYFKLAHVFGNKLGRRLMTKDLLPFLIGTRESIVNAATQQGDLEFSDGSYHAALQYRFIAGLVRLSIPGAVASDTYKTNLSKAAKFLFNQPNKTSASPNTVEDDVPPSPSQLAK